MEKEPSKSCDVRFVTRKWAPAIGGMETYCVRLCAELSQHNKVDVIALPGKANGDAPGVWQLLTFGVGTAFRLLAAEPARVVHIGDVSIWPLGWFASVRHEHSKIVLSAHGSDLSFAQRPGILSKLYGFYIGVGAKWLKRSVLIANSEWIATLAKDAGFENVRVVPLATDIEPPEEQDETVGQHNGALLFAGRILKSKGLFHFVKTVMPLLDKPLKIRVAGTIWDAEEAKILSDPLVEYLGPLNKDELAAEYASAVCVVVPSTGSEGFGLVVAEASAAGGIVLAADHSGLAETCTVDIGFVADIQNPEGWAKQLNAVLDWSPKRRASFISASQKTARKRFSWTRVATDTQKFYR